MKKLLLLCIPIILSACGGGSSTPAPGTATTGGSNGGSTGGGTTVNYPYNPSVNGNEVPDARVPYYGEWVWAVSFSSGTNYVGKMSISKRVSPLNIFTNTGGGAAVWCTNGDDCAYGGDLGLIGSAKSGGNTYLFGGLYDNSSYQQTKFVGIDSDGVVGTEVNGKPTISGVGQWYFYSGSTSSIGFAMVQSSTNPPIKSANVPISSNLTSKLSSPAALSALNTADLQKRALEVLKNSF